MSSREKLLNLVKIKTLKEEPPAELEIQALIQSGRNRLKDARNSTLSLESRFDLSYNAAHSLALAALRKCGFRADNRITVFECLEYTSALKNTQIRVLIDAHRKRNQAEYDGNLNLNEKLAEGVIEVAQALLDKI